MPKLGRPNSNDKRSYFINGLSEVQRKAPFGTNYTPAFHTKIIGSRYKRIEDNYNSNNLSSPRPSLTPLQLQDDNNKSINKKPILPPIFSERERIYQLSELIALLPAGNDLPSKALQLRNFEQISLLNITKHEISDIPDFISNLKRIYLMLTKIDINLTGACSFKEFVDSCYNNNVHLSWDLFRVIGSLFVVSNRDDVGFVHYENIISFLGAVFNSAVDHNTGTTREQYTHRESDRESVDQPLYFHDENCTDVAKDERNSQNYHVPVDDIDIVRSINEDLGFYPIPIQRIRLSCQRADSFHRGTLSAKQLEDICNNEGLNLRKSTFNRLLQRCKYMGGGQFNWQHFVDFMEKVQPISTGLQIPSSKMPLDFIKHIPAPASSWPHAESSDIHHYIRKPIIEKVSTTTQETSRQDFSQQHSPIPIYQDNSRNIFDHQMTPLTAREGSQRSNIPARSQEEPWFNKFLKFVDSVYLKDINSKGILGTKELFELATVLNRQLGLNFTTTELISALDGSSVNYDNSCSNINSFLKRLSIRSNT